MTTFPLPSVFRLDALARVAVVLMMAFTLLPLAGCGDASQPAVSPDGRTQVTLALNWVPEPEFGGFYAALQQGHYNDAKLDVTIRPGGAGAPTIQMIAAGQVPFGVVSADEVVIARSRGAKVVAIYAAYQTCPQGIMVHADRNIASIAQLMKTPGTIAMEPGLAYAKFLRKKYPPADGVNIVPYTSGVAQFLNTKQYSQQCFVFSEPIAARRAGADPKVFLVADEGYNPYTVVVATSEDFLNQYPQIVKAFVDATRQGWESYLADPSHANHAMAKLNSAMDAQTFIEAAKVQIPLVRTDDTDAQGLGVMTQARWQTLAVQLVDLGIIDTAPDASACFRAYAKSTDQPPAQP